VKISRNRDDDDDDGDDRPSQKKNSCPKSDFFFYEITSTKVQLVIHDSRKWNQCRTLSCST
jgi:hypothetical protein